MPGILDGLMPQGGGLLGGPRAQEGRFEDVIAQLLREGRIPQMDYGRMPMSSNFEDRRNNPPPPPILQQLAPQGMGLDVEELMRQYRGLNVSPYETFDPDMNQLMLLDSVRNIQGGGR